MNMPTELIASLPDTGRLETGRSHANVLRAASDDMADMN